jgi:sulfite exporter TauE/SafE/copper chaperone CopZ
MKPEDSSKSCSFRVDGMTCHTCEQAIKSSLSTVEGVEEVRVDASSGRLELVGKGLEARTGQVQKMIEGLGYRLAPTAAPATGPALSARALFKTLPYLLLAAVLVWGLQHLSLSGLDPAALGDSWIFVLGFGVLASFSACSAAVMGFLLAWQTRVSRSTTFFSALADQAWFQAGRLVGFSVLGGLIGVLGRQLSLSVRASGWMLLILAIMMVAIALDVLGFMPQRLSRARDRVSAFVFSRLKPGHERISLTVFGALTFFLPCGFTQTVQILALASGGFWQGAALLGVFALGTMPVLTIMGVTANRASKAGAETVARVMGSIILMMAISQFQNGWKLAGFPTLWGAQTSEAAQGSYERGMYVVRIQVQGTEYQPARTRVPLGRPVKILVEGSEARGCMRSFVIPKYNIRTELTGPETIVEFTPTQLGAVPFTCAMGMGDGIIDVVPEQSLLSS